MRIDKLLWFLRLASTRSFSQEWVMAGHMRVNGKRVEKPSTPVEVGDVLTLPMRTSVRIVEILTLPARRGPPAEARACYRPLDAGAPIAIAGGNPPDDPGAHAEVGSGYSEGEPPE